MEEKTIDVVINGEIIKLQSNNPDLKELIRTIIAQDSEYDFEMIEVNTDDQYFDKIGFRKILLEAIKEFKKSVELHELNAKNNESILDEKYNDLSES